MMAMHVVNRGFNYGQDGSGNRLVYHLLGCNMRCPWCANPEALDREKIPPGCRAYGPDEMVRQALSAKKILIDGGGVTFTGGEPTLHGAALLETLQKLRAAGLHTAMETNAASERFADFLPHLSLLIVDVKHYDDARHRAVTGVGNGLILRNLQRAAASGLPVWVRTPLVNGFNAGEEDVEGFLGVYRGFDTQNCSFELLPYHEYGRGKWAACGLAYTMQDAFVTDETKRRFEEAYTAAGLRVIHT